MVFSLFLAPPRRWRLRTGQHLLHRRWDHEFVVFNNLSGDCHLLDADGFDVLMCLGCSPEPMDAAALAGRLDADEPDDVIALEEVLAGLVACELIEALP